MRTEKEVATLLFSPKKREEKIMFRKKTMNCAVGQGYESEIVYETKKIAEMKDTQGQHRSDFCCQMIQPICSTNERLTAARTMLKEHLKTCKPCQRRFEKIGLHM